MSLKEQVTQPSEPSYRTIPLTQGQVTRVDAAEFDWLNQWKWCAKWSKFTKTFYAIRGCHVNGIPRDIKMHRQILGLEHGDQREGDHKNRDTLDNQRHNLRIATTAQNQHNAKKRTDNTSGFKGVSPWKEQWQASIQVNGKRIYLGIHPTATEAYAAYCEAANRLHGEFAHLG